MSHASRVIEFLLSDSLYSATAAGCSTVPGQLSRSSHSMTVCNLLLLQDVISLWEVFDLTVCDWMPVSASLQSAVAAGCSATTGGISPFGYHSIDSFSPWWQSDLAV